MSRVFVLVVLVLGASLCWADSFPPPPKNFASFPPAPRIVVDQPAIEAEAKPDVELIVFGAPWCSFCQPLKQTVKELQKQGWNARYQDIEETPDDRWTLYHKSLTKRLPHMITLIDDEPWYQIHGAREVEWLVDWLKRAENHWREKHGLDPVPFKAFGDTTLTAEEDRNFFLKEHWRLTPGTCGMMGCTVHGGGWVKETIRVPKTEEPADDLPEPEVPKPEAVTYRRSCPSCRR